jgi:hypothetical protein
VRSGCRLRALPAHDKGDHCGSGPCQRRGGVLITGGRVERATCRRRRPSELLTVNIDQILLLARTSPREEDKPLDVMTLFFTVLDRCRIPVREIEKLGRSAIDSNDLFIENLEVGGDDVVGEVGRGFSYLVEG